MKNKKDSSSRHLYGIGYKFRSIDIFGTSINLRVDGSPTYKTGIGACISILVIGIVANFAVAKFITLIKREDTSFSSWIVRDAIPVTEQLYHADTKFAIAFGFSHANWLEQEVGLALTEEEE